MSSKLSKKNSKQKNSSKSSFSSFFGFKRSKSKDDQRTQKRSNSLRQRISDVFRHDDVTTTRNSSKHHSLDRRVLNRKKNENKKLARSSSHGDVTLNEYTFDYSVTSQRQNKSSSKMTVRDDIITPAKVFLTEANKNEFDNQINNNDSNNNNNNNNNNSNNNNNIINENTSPTPPPTSPKNLQLKLDGSKAIKKFDLDKMMTRKLSSAPRLAEKTQQVSVQSLNSLPNFRRISTTTKTVVLNGNFCATSPPKQHRMNRFNRKTSGHAPNRAVDYEGRRKNDFSRKYSLPQQRRKQSVELNYKNIHKASPIVLKKFNSHNKSLLLKTSSEKCIVVEKNKSTVTEKVTVSSTINKNKDVLVSPLLQNNHELDNSKENISPTEKNTITQQTDNDKKQYHHNSETNDNQLLGFGKIEKYEQNLENEEKVETNNKPEPKKNFVPETNDTGSTKLSGTSGNRSSNEFVATENNKLESKTIFVPELEDTDFTTSSGTSDNRSSDEFVATEHNNMETVTMKKIEKEEERTRYPVKDYDLLVMLGEF